MAIIRFYLSLQGFIEFDTRYDTRLFIFQSHFVLRYCRSGRVCGQLSLFLEPLELHNLPVYDRQQNFNCKLKLRILFNLFASHLPSLDDLHS